MRVNGVAFARHAGRPHAGAGDRSRDGRLPDGRVRRRVRARPAVRAVGRVRHLRRSRARAIRRGRRASKRNAAATSWPTRRSSGWAAAERSRSSRWIHLYDPHAPYARRRSSCRKPAAHTTARSRLPTRRSAGVLEWLQTSGEKDRTIVAITSDHGEGLGDHGELTHGMLAYDSTLRVPLVIALPPQGGSHEYLPATRVASAFRRKEPLTPPCRWRTSRERCCRRRASRVPAGMHQAPADRESRSLRGDAVPARPPAGTTSPCSPSINGSSSRRRKSSSTTCRRIRERHATSRPQKAPLVDGARKRLRGTSRAQGGRGCGRARGRRRAAARARLRVGVPRALDADAANPARHIAAWNTFERELTRLSNGDARGALPGLMRLARALPRRAGVPGHLRAHGEGHRPRGAGRARSTAGWSRAGRATPRCITTSRWRRPPPGIPPKRRARSRPRWRCNRRTRPRRTASACSSSSRETRRRR